MEITKLVVTSTHIIFYTLTVKYSTFDMPACFQVGIYFFAKSLEKHKERCYYMFNKMQMELTL